METLQVNADRATVILNAQLAACVDAQCRNDTNNVLSLVRSVKVGARTVHGLIANTPGVVSTAGISATVLSLVFVLWMVTRNVADFKRWVGTISRGKKVPGCNVTTRRIDHDIARSAEYVAVFASTHLLAMLTLCLALALYFTLLGYSRTLEFISSRRNYIIA